MRRKFGAHPGSGKSIYLGESSKYFRQIFGIRRSRPRTGREKFKMSAEEDTELRDMVAQTLESKGVLGKIRVRKCVVLVKEEIEVKS